MLFNSFGYLVFLPIVVLLFWVSPHRLRTYLLLIASYVFYMSWKPVYGLLIFALTLLNYFFGLFIAKSQNNRKLLLTISVAANLLVLGIFKYAYFSLDLINQAITPWGGHLPAIPWEIILPLGISFFVFEFIHYLVEVYKGNEHVKSFPDFALFASFFPTQIAGPIKRYQDFIPQLAVEAKFNFSYFEEGINLIVFGMFKKVVFADNLAVVVQSAFEHHSVLSGLDLWLAMYTFAFQVYFDFSGYTDIARGSALLLGFKVPINFQLPYLASSIADYWRRWHISLSTWLRDYLYFPLGGSRGSRLFNYRNLLITMVLCGLWHRASMQLIVFGFLQGLLLILNKEFERITSGVAVVQNLIRTRVFHVFSILLTFHTVCLSYVFFRAETMATALSILQKMLFLPQASAMPAFSLSICNTSDQAIFLLLPLILIALFAGQLLAAVANKCGGKPLPIPLRAVYLASMVCLLMIFSPDTSPRFVYFQF